MTPDLPPCGYDNCDNPTQNYLCNECVTELHDDWAKIPDLLPTLKAISRGEDVAFSSPTAEGRTSTSTGSKPPLNLGALQLAGDLEYSHTITPQQWALDTTGPKRKTMIHRWVRTAHNMVHGEPDDSQSKANIARYQLRQLPPMPTKHLIPWLQEKTGIKITKQNIKDWARRGKLDRQNDTGHPTYSPADVLAAHANDRRTP